MNAKRYTPPSKGFANATRSRTPPNLNITGITSLYGSNGKSLRSGSASKPFRAQSLMNLNNTVSIGCPTIKSNLLSSNAVDKKLECEMVYNDYLQALMKKEIVSSIIKKHDQDLKDQLAIQRDNLHKSKMTLKKLKQEIDCFQTLSQVDELINSLQENINTYFRLIEEFGLNDTLEDLLDLLKLLCNKVYLINIKSMVDQEGIDKLISLLEKCLETLKKFESSGRPVEEVNKLGHLMEKYHLLKNSVTEKQSIANKQHKNETFKLLKTLSDMYASKENYNNDYV